MSPEYRKLDRAHTIYKNKDGKRVPGCSTIAGVMNKPALVPWANRMGLEGIDTNKYVDALANSGTLAHYLAECKLTEELPDPTYLDEFSNVDKSRAENSMKSFDAWYATHDIKVVEVELKLVCEELQVGGQLDSILMVDGILTLTDIKTSKALYGPKDDKWVQLAGYDLIAAEHGYDVKECRILRIGRDETEGFEFALMPYRDLQQELFRLCRQMYGIKGQLK
jgi:hypothetical protein